VKELRASLGTFVTFYKQIDITSNQKKDNMKKSKQAINDGRILEVLQSETSTDREKQNAFNVLYTNHERQVLTYFLKHGKNMNLAEDLKMITFEKIHANINKYNHESAVFSTWMYKIALHTMIDENRKNKKESNSISIDELISPSEENKKMGHQFKSPSLNPEKELIKNETLQIVYDAIENICNPVTRQMMKYRFIDGMSFKSIANEIGIKNNSTLRVTTIRESKKISELFKQKV